ncbi:MAG: hypothetical protein IPG79_14590 [Saprospiraceae bacterium]|nr:hypothetical protein [Saprospiraceae bacterium]
MSAFFHLPWTKTKKAFEYLDAGKKLYPDDNEILFAEINYYIKANKLNELVDKLQMAINKEPENVSVYNALGNVYDQLNQNERNAGNTAKADEYFNLAFKILNQLCQKILIILMLCIVRVPFTTIKQQVWSPN